MSKIFWTAEERASIKAELTRVFSANLNTSRHLALREAMLVLPLERRRVITHQTTYNEREMVEGALNAARRVVHAEPAAMVNTPPPAAAPPLQELVRSELGNALEHLIDLMVDRVVARVQSRMLIDKVSAAPAEVPSYDTAVARANAAHRSALAATERKPRPGVLIIGLLGAQAAEAVAAFPHLDITHMTSEEGLTRPQLLRAHTILMTKFISHSVQGKYRKAPNLHFCNGGVTELRRVLEEIAHGVIKC